MQNLENDEMNKNTEVNIKNSSTDSILDLLPPQFSSFLESNGISVEYFNTIDDFPRYIRLKLHLSSSLSLEDLQQDLGTTLVNKIDYIEGMYSIPGNIKIVNSSLYSRGLLYGIDLSSAAVVKALDPQPNEKVLDLCCCPGMKLCFIAELVKTKEGDKEEKDVKCSGCAVGVDINETRLSTCKSIVKKYKLEDVIQLECADGTAFESDIQFDRVLVDAECTHDGSLKHLAKFVKAQQVAVQELQAMSPSRKVLEKGALNGQDKDQKEKSSEHEKESSSKNDDSNLITQTNNDNLPVEIGQTYEKDCKDMIIPDKSEQQNVDTLSNKQQQKHQQSKKQPRRQGISRKEEKRRAKQLEKNNSNIYTQKKSQKNEWSLDDFQDRVLDPVKLSGIVDLQKKLLTNGLKLCRVGGVVVYSTCSFARAQNEDVVEWFLKEHPEEIEQLEPFSSDVKGMPCKPGFIPMTVRFDPLVSKSGGMFVSKFRKIK